MNRIMVLPEQIAHQIAAGEVIERPLSILKELVENSIDAQATKIDIHVFGGGIDHIKIVDNGYGIVEEDLPLALLQHATSKIKNADDLYKLSSLGFRGEALSSMASVAKLSITSKRINANAAFKVESNDYKSTIPCAHPSGTTVEVKDLFYNVPARKKFLRTKNTEYLNIEQMFNRLVLGYFNIAFRLYRDGKMIKNTRACNSMQEQESRLESICGKDMLLNCSNISVEQNGMILTGWLSMSSYDRPQGDRQFFYINNRSVKDRVISHAIKQSYMQINPNLRYPAYCLYLTIDKESVDVNVHPTKNEVRFRDSAIVHHFITDTIAEYFSRTQIETSVELLEPSHSNTMMAVHGGVSSLPNYKGKIEHLFGGSNNYINNKYNDLIKPNVHDRVTIESTQLENDEQMRIGENIVCIKVSQGLQLVNIEKTWRTMLLELGVPAIREHHKLPTMDLLIPVSLDVNVKVAEHFEQKHFLFGLCGFSIDRVGGGSVIFRKVPLLFKHYNWKLFEPGLVFIINKIIEGNEHDLELVFSGLVKHMPSFNFTNKEISEIVANTNNLQGKILTEDQLLDLIV